MKLDSSDWSGAAPVSARVWGEEREEYNGLTDIILKFALSWIQQ